MTLVQEYHAGRLREACFFLTLSAVKIATFWQTQYQTHDPFGSSDFVVVAPPPKNGIAVRPGRPLRIKMRPPSLFRSISFGWLTEMVGRRYEPAIRESVDDTQRYLSISPSGKPRAPWLKRNVSHEAFTALPASVRS